jgi:hypothetical protein
MQDQVKKCFPRRDFSLKITTIKGMGIGFSAGGFCQGYHPSIRKQIRERFTMYERKESLHENGHSVEAGLSHGQPADGGASWAEQSSG